MREIKFRAKPTTGGYPWVYGNAVIQTNGKAYLFEDTDGCAGVFEDGDPESSCYIVDGLLEVYPETVGQYTGLKSRDGHKIFEGDILREIGRKEYAEETGIPEEELMNLPLEAEREVVVIYEAPRFVFAPNGYGYRFLNNPHLFRVVGNIHENPELK